MLKDILRTEINKAVRKLGLNQADFSVERDERFADYASNVALVAGGTPRENAETIKGELEKSKIFNALVSKTEVAGPGFLNFWVKQEAAQNEFEEIVKQGKKFGQSKSAKKQTVVIDYSGPNIAKPMGIGHLRSTIIGQALYNIFKFAGYKVIGDNHLGDWGTQFGMLIAGYKEAIKQKKKINTIGDLMEIYVDFNKRVKEDASWGELARLETKKLQSGDQENTKIWKLFYQITQKELGAIYKILGVKFDYQLGESFYNKMLPAIVADAIKKGIAHKSEGATVIDIESYVTPLLIQKTDGAYLYATTDLATIKYREHKFKPGLILYVVANEQTMPLDQLFKAAEMMGMARKAKLEHVKFGMMLAEDAKKFSTRQGKIISLVEVIDEAVARAQKIIEEKQPQLKEKEKKSIALAVGVGALKYNDLSQNRLSDIAFNWDKMLSMEGNSAPYLQYTRARLNSILRKAKPGKPAGRGGFDVKFLREERESKIILLSAEFPDVIAKITQTHYPHYLSDFLYKLAKEANAYYQAAPVLNAEKGVKEARLALINKISETIKTGLNLLGIEAPERM